MSDPIPSTSPLPDLSRLLELAKDATPGPWFAGELPWFRNEAIVLAGSPDPHKSSRYICQWDEFLLGINDSEDEEGLDLGQAQRDAAFISAVDPTSIKALIDGYRFINAELAAWKERAPQLQRGLDMQRVASALIAELNALPYCPFCGQGRAMHTQGCRLLPLMIEAVMP